MIGSTIIDIPSVDRLIASEKGTPFSKVRTIYERVTFSDTLGIFANQILHRHAKDGTGVS